MLEVQVEPADASGKPFSYGDLSEAFRRMSLSITSGTNYAEEKNYPNALIAALTVPTPAKGRLPDRTPRTEPTRYGADGRRKRK